MQISARRRKECGKCENFLEPEQNKQNKQTVLIKAGGKKTITRMGKTNIETLFNQIEFKIYIYIGSVNKNETRKYFFKFVF